VGYCLYRSKKKNAEKQNSTCSDCEQINSQPIIETRCLDNLVEDGTTYYYVVTSTNAKGKISSSSNEIPVQVPLNTDPLKSDSPGSYPLCRTAKALK
jgi:fibronectin type 3 domain-containing protein